MGGGGGGASGKLKKAAKKIFVQTCGSFCQTQPSHLHNSTATTAWCDSPNYSSPPENQNQNQNQNQNRNISCKKILSEISGKGNSTTSPSTKNLCAICLEPLNYSSGSSAGQAIFTAQCSHSFHFACISSNVSHGSVTCPICRAHWTQLPHNLNIKYSADPILQILDDSIANSRVHRRSFLRSAQYNDDDPVDPTHHPTDQPRLHLSLAGPLQDSSCLRVRLSHQPATDLVLVASPNGPHLRLMKQAMALVVFSLRHVDRLAVVTYSSAAARVFPLRRMTSYGKRNALQVIDRLFYMGQADPMEGLKKGVKILGDRVHKNPNSCILHLTDAPPSYRRFEVEEVPVRIQRFSIGLGFGGGASNGLIMREFEEFLARTLGGAVRDVQMRVGEGRRVIRIGELRGGEERNIPVYLGECGPVCVEYSYVEGGDGECVVRRGEVVVGENKGENGSESGDGGDVGIVGGGGGGGGRMSSGGDQCWEYHDPFMARRWAKHLHGYRL
ncbi:hypothetical protein ACP275_13G126000 [Erythranthe tilingii]